MCDCSACLCFVLFYSVCDQYFRNLLYLQYKTNVVILQNGKYVYTILLIQILCTFINVFWNTVCFIYFYLFDILFLYVQAQNPDELSIVENEQLEVVGEGDGDGWLRARNYRGEEGFVPHNYLDVERDQVMSSGKQITALHSSATACLFCMPKVNMISKTYTYTIYFNMCKILG